MMKCIVLVRFVVPFASGSVKFCNPVSLGFKYFSSARTHYEVLGLNQSCSNEDIKKAYIKLCKQFHPDVKPGDTAQHKKFVELNSAYHTLVNEQTRKAYDRNFGSQWSGSYDSSWRYQGTHYSSFNSNTWKDETIYYHKRKSQKQFYEDPTSFDARHLPKGWIVAGCFVLIFIGTMMYLSAYSFATNYTYSTIDAKSEKISRAYIKAKENAQENGKQRQLEKLHQHWGLSAKSLLDDE